jgi:hypothetical protein
VIGSIPRPNQAFWTLSALWAGWLWGREAVEPFKVALRRRRYDWAWNATALNSTFAHLFELLPLGTPIFGLLPEPEPPFLTSALTAASAAGFDLTSLALRTEHDPIQLTWTRGEHLKREVNDADIEDVKNSIHSHLSERGEPASYLHVHMAGLTALAETHALKKKEMEFDEALRSTNALIQNALSDDDRFVHYSTGENVDTGMWGLTSRPERSKAQSKDGGQDDSLSDRIEVAVVTFLQKNSECIYLEVENELNPQFPGLITPSKGMIYAVLNSYAERNGGSWKLRPEDFATARRNELNTVTAMLEVVGKRLDYTTYKQEKFFLWKDGEKVEYAIYILASALVGRAMTETPYPPEQTIIVIPGGRAGLIQYKAQRDPSLAERIKNYQLVKYRLLRSLVEVPVLTRDTFREQIAGDPLEKSKSQMMMF